MPTAQAPRETLCLVQIARIGDVLQTYQAAMHLKEENPHLRLILVAREKFARSLEFLLNQAFDQIHYLDLKHIIFSKGVGLEQALSNLHQFLNNLKDEGIKVLINLSFSKSSTYLCGLIPAKFRLGPYRDAKSQLLIEDSWGQFIYANVMGGPNNPFHLVDIFRSLLGAKKPSLAPQCPQGEWPLASQVGQGGREQQEKWRIILHPFASHKKKMWSVQKWAEILALLLRDHPQATLLIIGHEGDRLPTEALLQHPHLAPWKERIDNRVGQTHLQDLFDLLGGARLFIGHDSMGGHMASLLHVRTLTLSLGTVRPHETTPYGEKNVNLVPRTPCFPCFPSDPCHDLPCHGDIAPTLVAEVAGQLLTQDGLDYDQLQKRLPESHLASVTIYQTRLNEFHEIVLESLSPQGPQVSEVFLILYRILWNFFLKDREEALPFPKLSPKTAYHLKYYQEGLEKLYELQEFGKKYSLYLLQEFSKDQWQNERIQEYSGRIGEIDRLLATLKGPFPLLAPLVDYYHVVKSNLPGQTPREVAISAHKTYEEAALAVSVIYELIGKTLQHSGPQTRVLPTSAPYGVNN